MKLYNKCVFGGRVVENVFEIVEEFPLGYKIWNIGKNMTDGYLPLCRLSPYQPFPGGRNIDIDTLKAIKVDGAQDILAAIGKGANTLAEMEEYVENHKNSKKDYEKRTVTLFSKAIPIMKQIKSIQYWNQ